MAAPDKIKKLVDDFERLKRGRVPDSFDEAQLRVSYVNPFWEALGWNVRDYREVVIEKVVPMRHSTKRADYCFLLNGRPAFVLETKDFRKHLDDPDIVFQLNRYGYNLPVDFGFLTNFAELQLYETWKRPLIENPVKNRVNKFHFDYQEYVERWDELAAALARDAVAAGALNEFLTKKEPTRNKEAVDRKFFEGLNEWRAELARVIALRNIDLSVHDINEAVQRILDRCIFMRVIEDRGIEATELLLDALTRWGREKEKPLYRYVVDKFRYLDPQYNGELFEKHFSEELLVDDKPLRDFMESLYYPKSPYQFNVVGVEMLGTIYERFLGSTIRLTKTHRAVVEEKPEVRKAGGVYYTPKYIVDYIVENTVGELLKKCKTPAAVAKLKILDPACGSGSFLLGAFQRLIDWHEDYFNANPDKIGKGLAAACWHDAEEGKYRLTARYKGQILVNNLFGVDIDPQACEVTRMSLYLKILESVNVQFLMKTALLPQLDNNIKCGNSLIGSDYWDFVREKQRELFERTEKEERRVNPFDWEVEFEEIMQNGGFDAVIGNPPYIRSIALKEVAPLSWAAYRKVYKSASEKEWDIYLCFVEKGLTVLSATGKLSYIIPNKFVNSQVGANLRTIISEGRHLEALVHFGAFQVFAGATNYTCLLFLTKQPNDKATIWRFTGELKRRGDNCPLPEESQPSWVISEQENARLGAAPWVITTSGKSVDLKKYGSLVLRDIADVFQGTGTRADSVFCVRLKWKTGRLLTAFSYALDKELHLETALLHRVFRGKDIGRYTAKGVSSGLLLPYERIEGKYVLIKEAKLRDMYPKAFAYLRECKPILDAREDGRFKGKGWYCFGRPQNLNRFETAEKIVCPDVVDKGSCYLDRGGFWLLDTTYGIKLKEGIPFDLRYLVGILNSPLLTRFLKETGTPLRGGYFRMKTAYLNPFPIRAIDFNDKADVKRHDKMVALVEEMLELHKRLAAAKSDADKKRIQRAVDATDRRIDALVYELYALTDEEIRTVEGNK